MLPWKSSLEGLVLYFCCDGVVGFGGGGGIMTHDLFIRPLNVLQAAGISRISLRSRASVGELVGSSSSLSGSGSGSL